MRKLFLLNLTILSVLVFCTAASAAPYVSAGLGLFSPNDSDLEGRGSLSGSSGDVSFESGSSIYVAAGVDVDDLRLEGELSYREAYFDSINLTDGVTTLSQEISGDVSATSFMFNIWKDFELGKATPYVGGGFGFVEVEVSDSEFWSSGIDTVVGYQLGTGVGLELKESLVLDLSYRYFFTSDVTFEITEAEFSGHNLLAGVRLQF